MLAEVDVKGVYHLLSCGILELKNVAFVYCEHPPDVCAHGSCVVHAAGEGFLSVVIVANDHSPSLFDHFVEIASGHKEEGDSLWTFRLEPKED